MIILLTPDCAEANSYEVLHQTYGSVKAKKIRQRLDELDAASNLLEFASFPHIQCKRLENGRELVAVCTVPDARLILRIIEQIPSNDDERAWQKVSKVSIIRLDDPYEIY